MNCIGGSEIDKYAIAISRYNYPEHRNFGDVSTLDVSRLPDFDCLCFGWPCQDNSIAGKRKGLRPDTRSGLLFEAVRVLRGKKPKYFIAENVKGLYSVNDGYDFYTAIRMFTDIGYDCQWQLLNSGEHAVPQNRERVYFVGHRGGERRPKVFPLKATSWLDTENIACTLTTRGYERQGNGTYIIASRPHGYNKGCLKKSLCLRSSYGWLNEVLVQKDGLIRTLTPIEWERLQGFPDNWTKYGIDESGKQIEISDTQRYNCIGNAVTTNVVQAIIERMPNFDTYFDMFYGIKGFSRGIDQAKQPA